VKRKDWILAGLTTLGVFVGIRMAKGKGIALPKGSPKWRKSKFPLIWDVVLKGESKTFDDYNYYAPSLKGVLNAKDTQPFSSKTLTQLKVSEVMAFQSRSRSQGGQLWAVGRFQIIPVTLKELVNAGYAKPSDKFDEDTQIKLGDALVMRRPNLINYLNGKVADNQRNLELAALDVSKIWSSVGVPYAINGKAYNQSYYSKDKASVDTTDVQKALKNQRKFK